MGKRGKKHWLYVAIPYNLRVKTAGIFFLGGIWFSFGHFLCNVYCFSWKSEMIL